MKKRIIIGLTLSAVLFAVGGVYILSAINYATEELNELIQLHQVEILREHYLLEIRRVQSNLTLEGTLHERSFETMVAHAVRMRRFVDACFGCHHEQPVLERIQEMDQQTERYQQALSRVLTIRANEERLRQQRNAAFHIGEDLITQVGEMIALTGSRLERATQESMQEIEDTKYALYVLVVLAPLLAVILGYVFISGLTSPVKSLLRSTRRLQAGDLEHRVTGLTGEFGELGDAFNEMAGSLTEHVRRMQRAEQLAVCGELSAGLAHEIKNPLAGIKVAMHVLAEEPYLTREDRQVVAQVGKEITRLEILMKSFLDFARPAKPRFEAIDVGTLLHTTLTFYDASKKRPGATSRDIEIVKEFAPVPATGADPMQLQQVFLNLIINAVDAMPDGGTLTIRTSFDEPDDAIEIEFEDTGGGIDPDYADAIFQPFFTTKQKGTGLGLSICRQLIEQHGGTIAARRTSQGGTRFVIRLPLNPVSDGVAA